MYPSNKKKKVWREEKERLLKMTLEERRKEYIRDHVPLNTIPSWREEMKGKNQNDGCISNGRSGGGWHEREYLRILAW
uniref:Mono-ADP ribosylhydrolase 2 n=1 Tax=Ictidomys tridecemlineatus TaxID=43179 RepID=I3N1D5_ICTTR